MSRHLPILLMQSTPIDGPERLEVFADDLRLRLTQFPRTRLVVYPELHLSPGESAEDIAAQAEPRGGPREASLQALAAELGIWLIPGTVHERAENGRIHNTALVISPDGTIVARYRKCFPWRPREEVTPGVEFVVFDIPGLTRIGVSICYDTWFPEVARHLAWMGAEAIVQVTLTTTADRAQELVLSQATAIVNQVFVLSVNAAAPQATGRSIVVDPEGNVVAGAGEGPLALSHVIDLDQVTGVREYGTAGMTRVWSQFTAADAPLPLPLYDGRIDPKTWHPHRPVPTEGTPERVEGSGS